MTEENTSSPTGEHSADNIDVPNYHFNVLKVVQDAKQQFETRNGGKTAKFFYAPEPFLYMVDQAIKSRALATGVNPDMLRDATITQVFGMELVSILGTCVTVTAEAVHDDEPEEVAPGIVVPNNSTELN